jgi:hypothetical protein
VNEPCDWKGEREREVLPTKGSRSREHWGDSDRTGGEVEQGVDLARDTRKRERDICREEWVRYGERWGRSDEICRWERDGEIERVRGTGERDGEREQVWSI